jgi:hypothetical protein
MLRYYLIHLIKINNLILLITFPYFTHINFLISFGLIINILIH